MSSSVDPFSVFGRDTDSIAFGGRVAIPTGAGDSVATPRHMLPIMVTVSETMFRRTSLRRST